MTVLDDIRAQLASGNGGENPCLEIDRFDHWRNPEDAMVRPTRTGCSTGTAD
ncbi:hypothetical protein [Kibdelosporangium phytohabitans]|uniref:hypothetical protein n=1 Tax=Kibdelosporangium phytohabitans TaxID=860235 RepID=UPI0012F94E55|nr:hypothetical protein [Kibdelosporangium phytohabitans]MBE1469443.1 hypothetical protein [Kibdelosporangium phytohabitans]